MERREVEAVKTLFLLHIAMGLKLTSLICRVSAYARWPEKCFRLIASG